MLAFLVFRGLCSESSTLSTSSLITLSSVADVVDLAQLVEQGAADGIAVGAGDDDLMTPLLRVDDESASILEARSRSILLSIVLCRREVWLLGFPRRRVVSIVSFCRVLEYAPVRVTQIRV